MKALRIVLVIVAVLALLFAVALVLALQPSVQTWAVRRALRSNPEMHGTIERVDAGFKRIEIRQLTLQRPGLRLTIPSATMDVPLVPAAREHVSIQRLVSKGWILDLSGGPAATAPTVCEGSSGLPLAAIGLGQATPLATAPAPAAPVFDGIFQQLKLPVDFSLETAELEGDVIFPTKPGQPAGRAHVVIAGGGLSAGRTGKFTVHATTEIQDPKAPVQHVQSDATLQAHMDTPRTFDTIIADTDLNARGMQFPNGARLKASVHAVRGSAEETYLIALRSDADHGKELLHVEAKLPLATRRMAGTWHVDASDTDVAPFTLGFALPKFYAVGEGLFETDRDGKQVHASGQFKTDLEHLENVVPALSEVGPLHVTSEFDLHQQENAVRVDRLLLNLRGAQPVADLEALQSFEFDTATGELKVADPGRDLVRAKLTGVPLAWVRPYVRGVSIGGGDVQGEMVASARGGGLTVRSTAPLRVPELSVSQDGQLLLSRADLRADFAGEYSPATGWQADVSSVSLQRGTAPAWLTAELKVGQLPGANQPLKATGQYQIGLADAVRQPALAAFNRISGGKLAGDFTAIVAPQLRQFALRANLQNATVDPGKQALPSVTLNARADLQADGTIKLQAPIVVQQGDRKSDLQATAEIKPTGAQQSIDAHVTSEQLYVEDLKLLSVPFSASEETNPPAPEKRSRVSPTSPAAPASPGNAASAAPRSEPADTAPFWAARSGTVQLDLKKVVYSPDVQAANVTGKLTIQGDRLAVENLRAVMGQGSDAKVNGSLKFEPRAKAPYALTGDLNVNNVNPGPLLAMLSPVHQPTVEGPFDVVGSFSGDAANLDELADQTNADLKLTSRGGKFHGFAASASTADLLKYQKTLGTVGALLEAAAGMVGSSQGASTAERVRAAIDAMNRFVEIDFDQLNLQITHQPGSSTQIKDFSLISPEIRLVGTGSIANQPGVSWMDRALHLDLSVAVRGDQAKDMKKLGLLKPEPDPLGYTPLTDKITVEGTVSNMTATQLNKLLTRVIGKL